MANDTAKTARLDDICRELEARAGIPTPSTAADTTITARLERISVALATSANPNPFWAQLTDITDGEILVYRVGEGWINSTVTAAATDLRLRDLVDVANSLSPASGDILQYGGTEWDAISPINLWSLSDLSDVDDSLSPPVIGAYEPFETPTTVLGWNRSTTQWEADTLFISDLDGFLPITTGDQGTTPVFAPFNPSVRPVEIQVSYIPIALYRQVDVNIPGPPPTFEPADDALLMYDLGSSKWTDRSAAYLAALVDHGTLLGLSDDDHTQYLLADGTRALTGAWDAQDNITVDNLYIEATIDHEIEDDGSDNLCIHNLNQDKYINFQINDGGTVRDFVRILGADPALIIDDGGTPVTSLGGPGIIQVTGDWGRLGAWGVMRFNPTITAGTPIAFFLDPEIDGPVSAFGTSSRHTVASGQNLTHVGYEYAPGGNVSAGQTQTLTGFADYRSVSLTDAGSTWNRVGAQLGVSAPASIVSAGGTVNDTHLSLHGGANQFLGTFNQWGIRMQGYGTAGSGATVYALHSDGGTFAWAADNAEIRMGGGEDTRMYYDGSNYILDPDVVGSGRIYIGATGDDDMLLNDIEIDGDLDHDGSNIGFFGTAPTTQAPAYTPTNVTTDRSYDANSTTLDEVADVLGTLIADLQSYGLLA